LTLPGGFPIDDVVRILDERTRDETSEVRLGVATRLVARNLGQGANGRHFALYDIRGDEFPMLYEHGVFRPLEEVLEDGTDIAEVSYFAIFPGDTLGMIYNHRGPKQGQFSAYLMELTDLEVQFIIVTRPDLIESIARAGGVRLLNLAVRLEDMGQMRAMGLPGIRALAQEVPAGEVEVILHARTVDQRRNLGRYVQALLPRLGGPNGSFKKARAVLTDADALTDGRTVDLLEDRLVMSQEVDTILGHRNFLDEDSAVQALEDAYAAVEARLA
jgi:hypothetical protein